MADSSRPSGARSSSHDEIRGLEAAGWLRGRPGTYRELLPARTPELSWLRPRILWRSRNDRLARWLRDPTNAERRRWMRAQRDAGVAPDLIVRDHAGRDAVSFLVLGDTGEGDASQFVVVPPLLRAGEGTDFMVICSDVIYPTGDANEYVAKFYFPYKDYPGPIYAVPGNHDWYDDLTSFMTHFCGAPPLPRDEDAVGRPLAKEWLE
jgi:hypothetical protein